MEKRAEEINYDALIYTSLALVFIILMFFFITGYQDGSAFWEDFYAKQISYMINNAEVGTEFELDVSKLAVIAIKNGKNYRDIISIDNVHNRVFVSTRPTAGTSFNFFKDFDVVDSTIEIPSGSATTTRIIFKIVERQRDD
ncbi:MAG: hypothetical protein ACP5NS_02210 [Candidatus Pacearchaeota archaeon]